MPHDSELDTLATELPERVDPEVFEKLETAFGDDWQHFPEEEQRKICEVLGDIPEPSARKQGTYTRKLLEDLRDIVGLCIYRGIEWSPIVAILGYANATTLKNKLIAFNDAHPKKPIHFMTKAEEALLAEVERQLPTFTEKTGRKCNADIATLAPLAVTWLRLHKKKAFSSQISAEARDNVKMGNKTAKPEEDNHGTSFVDLLPDNLKAILNPPPKADVSLDAAVRDVQADLRDTLKGGAGDDAGPVETGVVCKHLGEKVDEPNDVPKQPAEFQPETLVQRAARFAQRNAEPASEPENVQPESSGEVATISDANRALIEEILKVSPRFAAILESIPAGEENSAKARSAESMIHVFETIAQRIAGNAQPSQNSGRQPLVLGNDVIQLDDETLRGIEAGRLVFRVTTHSIIIEKGRTEEAAAEVAGAKQ